MSSFEYDPQIAEVVSRLKSYKLRVCQDCGGQGYTDSGRSACFWCRGAGVITQQMAYAFGVADRAEREDARRFDDTLRMHLKDAANTFVVMDARLRTLSLPGSKRREIADECRFRADQFFKAAKEDLP